MYWYSILFIYLTTTTEKLEICVNLEVDFLLPSGQDLEQQQLQPQQQEKDYLRNQRLHLNIAKYCKHGATVYTMRIQVKTALLQIIQN